MRTLNNLLVRLQPTLRSTMYNKPTTYNVVKRFIEGGNTQSGRMYTKQRRIYKLLWQRFTQQIQLILIYQYNNYNECNLDIKLHI